MSHSPPAFSTISERTLTNPCFHLDQTVCNHVYVEHCHSNQVLAHRSVSGNDTVIGVLLRC